MVKPIMSEGIVMYSIVSRSWVDVTATSPEAQRTRAGFASVTDLKFRFRSGQGQLGLLATGTS